MKRAYIVLDKNLSAGQSSNVSAILMGELVSRCNNLYAGEEVADKTGTCHAAICCSTIILSANSGTQLANFVNGLVGSESVNYCVFTSYGQNLHNEPEEYAANISQSETSDNQLVGVGLYGEHDVVKQLTKKFRLLQ